MFKKIFAILMAILFFILFVTGCKPNISDKDVTDLQLVLLNNILLNDNISKLKGDSIEGQDELIGNKYKENILDGNKLIDQLKGYTLSDYESNENTGFIASSFTKGHNLVIVYGGTNIWNDWEDNTPSVSFDFSQQDSEAKTFLKNNVSKYKDYNLYISGNSLGGRLCYIASNYAIENSLTDKLIKVCTFNGVGTREYFDVTDSDLSFIHNLKSKIANITSNYIVEGDAVSDGDNYFDGYHHIGTEYRVSCTNNIDDSTTNKEHDLYSIIDYFSNESSDAENSNSEKKHNSKIVLNISDNENNLMGDFINLDEDINISDWDTFVSKYPEIADPMDQGSDYSSKMHLSIFFLRDSEGNIIDNKGVLNATGFGNDSCGWKDKYGEFDWMYTDTAESYDKEDFCICYEGEYYLGPAECGILNAKIKEYITMGKYKQSSSEDADEESIEWLVLTDNNEKMLVVSKLCLDYLKYPNDWDSNISWETSSLREYLNSDFYKNTFTDEEQNSILKTEIQNKASEDFYSTVDGKPTKDNVFLLSIDEVQIYLPASTSSESSKIAYGTDYLYNLLQSNQYYTNDCDDGEPLNWVLRADIDISRNEENFGRPREISVVGSEIKGTLSTGGTKDPNGPLSIIRPAMWIKSTVPKYRNLDDNNQDDNESEEDKQNNEKEESAEDKNDSDNKTSDEKDDFAQNESSSWSDMYYHLIIDNNYSIELYDDYNSKINVNSNTPFALHDFDMDGTPELIIGVVAARLGLEVFTIYNGNVVHAGGMGGRSSFYSDNPSYHGIFRSDSWSDTQVLCYTGLSNGKLVSSEVITGKLNQSTKQYDYTISDDTLYDVYLNCTTSDSDEISTNRKENNNLQLYYWSDIESNGWDTFINYFGY